MIGFAGPSPILLPALDPAEAAPPTALLAIDWGSTSLRGARLAGDGRVLERRGFERGVLSVPAGGFAAVFDECFGDWMRQHAALCQISGMAGSRQGWIEVPYASCPAGLADIAAKRQALEHGAHSGIWLVPGLSCRHAGAPDVMRGEETQVFGAARQQGRGNALCVLPGTHSKWVVLAEGRIEGFCTYMTGEVFDLLRRHSILARTLPEGEPVFDAAAFDAAVLRAQQGPGLLSHAFGLRAMALFEEIAPAARTSWLSGLVIGDELRGEGLRDGLARAGREVWVIGSELLTERYVRALGVLGVPALAIGPEATWQGHHAIWKATR